MTIWRWEARLECGHARTGQGRDTYPKTVYDVLYCPTCDKEVGIERIDGRNW